jgi:hypothetical protein
MPTVSRSRLCVHALVPERHDEHVEVRHHGQRGGRGPEQRRAAERSGPREGQTDGGVSEDGRHDDGLLA